MNTPLRTAIKCPTPIADKKLVASRRSTLRQKAQGKVGATNVYSHVAVISPTRRPQGESVQGPQLFTVRIQRAREQPNNMIHEPLKVIRGASLGSEEEIGSGPLPAVARDIKVATTQKEPICTDEALLDRQYNWDGDTGSSLLFVTR